MQKFSREVGMRKGKEEGRMKIREEEREGERGRERERIKIQAKRWLPFIIILIVPHYRIITTCNNFLAGILSNAYCARTDVLNE